jgi:predicted nucleic acid-binding protein
VLALAGAAGEKVEFLRGAALDLEIDQNRLVQRAARVRLWLETWPLLDAPAASLADRTLELIVLGFKCFDALYVASAEVLGADALSTCDDRLLAAARGHSALLKVRVVNQQYEINRLDYMRERDQAIGYRASARDC